MSEETKKLVLLGGAAIFLLVVVVVFVVGLINPFWCDIPVINIVSCVTGIAENRESQVSESVQEVLEPTDAILTEETPVQVIPTPPYQDLEQARSSDPVLEAYVQSLKKALEEADFATLETLVSETFNIGGYASEYNELTRADVIAILKNEIQTGQISVDISNEGRKVAQEAYVTPREGTFALLSKGWPEKSILGVTKIGDTYFWTDLVIDVP